MTTYDEITQETIPDGTRIVARAKRWNCVAPFLGALAFLGLARLVRLAEQNQPAHDPTGPLYFMWLLLMLAFGLGLLGVSTFRNRISLFIRERQIVLEQCGLLKRRIVCSLKRGERYYVLVEIRKTSVSTGAKSGSGHGLVPVASIHVVDSKANRQRLTEDIDDVPTIKKIANAITEILGLPACEVVPIAGHNSCIKAHRRRLEQKRRK